MDSLSAQQDHNMLGHPASDPDYMMNDLAADILPFDLDLNAIPDANVHGFDNHTSHSLNASSLQSNADGMDGMEREDKKDQIIIGAGPLPTGFGVQLAPGQGSTLTEFTKRRNWSQRVIEELKDFLHILSSDGRFLYVSPSTKTLTGFDSQDLVGKVISDYIHPDDSHMFVREFNESIATGNPLRFFYRFRKSDDSYAIFESHGHPHLAADNSQYGGSGASFCRGFFMMARPYPTKNAALLDSFLEHRTENERLRKRIAELKREEQEDLESQQQLWLNKQPIQSMASSDTSNPFNLQAMSQDPSTAVTPQDYNGMPPPPKPTISNTALTRQNLNEALASSRPDSINDKMARYEGATHFETIEMLTGLRYRDGERSKGISTGAQSPTLVRGDAGIPIQVDKEGRPAQSSRAYSGSPYSEGLTSEKKKKIKVADEYVCTDCGTLDSPEWRKGPSGPKTLCNACGLRWAKKEKKRGGHFTDNGSANGTSPQTTTPAYLGSSGQQTPLSSMASQANPSAAGVQPIAPATHLSQLSMPPGPT